MKKILTKIMNFFIFFSVLGGAAHAGQHIRYPKKKDYIGRIVLTIFGFIIFVFIAAIVILFFINLF